MLLFPVSSQLGVGFFHCQSSTAAHLFLYLGSAKSFLYPSSVVSETAEQTKYLIWSRLAQRFFCVACMKDYCLIWEQCLPYSGHADNSSALLHQIGKRHFHLFDSRQFTLMEFPTWCRIFFIVTHLLLLNIVVFYLFLYLGSAVSLYPSSGYQKLQSKRNI